MVAVKETRWDLNLQLRELKEGLFQRKKNPFEGTPEYLQAEAGEKDLTQGKRYYLRAVGAVAEELIIPSESIALICGGGRGLESTELNKAFLKREEKGEDLKGVQIKTVDIDAKILKRIKKTTKSRRIKEGLMLADVTDLSKIKDNSVIFATICSIMHELGKKDAVKAFTEVRRKLQPGGIILFREFFLPTRERQTINLKTPFARRFFPLFEKYFLPEETADWRLDFKKEGDTINCGAVFAFEFRQHLRFFLKNYYLGKTDKMKEEAFNFFSKWQELKQRYSLEIQTESADITEMMKSLIRSAGKLEADYVFTHRKVPDRDDDTIVKEHLNISEISADSRTLESPIATSERVVCFMRKIPKDTKDSQRNHFVDDFYNFVKRVHGKASLQN